jgi:hypothetical protein
MWKWKVRQQPTKHKHSKQTRNAHRAPLPDSNSEQASLASKQREASEQSKQATAKQCNALEVMF